MMMRTPAIVLAIARAWVLLVVLLPGLALAAPDDCVPTVTALVFDAYDTLNPAYGTATVSVSCENPTGPSKTFNYTLKLSKGPGSYTVRNMTGTGDTLNYNLYTSASYGTVWGDGSGGSSSVTGSITVPGGATLIDTKTIFGRITAPQNVLPGLYSTATPIILTLSGVKSSDKTDSFTASVTVATRCEATAGNLAFGTINPLSSQTDSFSTITVQCSKNTPYTVGLSAGATSGATVTQRLMANGSNTMLYNLYTNSTRTTVWGNSSGSWVSRTGAGMGVDQPLTVYGRVASGQTNLASGSYSEPTITVTVTY